MAKLKVGDKAPYFKGKDQNGQEISLDKFKGKKIVLYFYPKDDTLGCTAQACNLRDNYTEFQNNGYVVLGVSADDEKSHEKFADRYQLPFPLIADPEKKIILDYRVWGGKIFFGKAFKGILRTTFIISEEGIIEKIIDKVKTKDHSRQIFDKIKH